MIEIMKYIGYGIVGLIAACVTFFTVLYSGGYFVKTEVSRVAHQQTFLPDSAYKDIDVRFGTHTFRTLVADTAELQSLGLSYRDGLLPDQAMLFVFKNDHRHPFWMKDMRFPIDIIWLSSDKKVVFIKSNASPSTYPETFGPTENTLYVLEVAAGTAEKLGITVGQKFSFLCNGYFCN